MRCKPYQSNGFTLVEMMVALLIFSMLSIAGVALLRSAVNSDEITGQNLNEMADMQRFVSLMEADLSQALPRSYRADDGGRMAAFETRDAATGFLRFTRGGQSNLNDKPRSNLQRVEYRLVDGRIERLFYESTDGGAISEPARLLENVEGLQLRVRDKGGLWASDWRTERLADLPRAVELRFQQDGRSYRHLFLVGTGYL